MRIKHPIAKHGVMVFVGKERARIASYRCVHNVTDDSVYYVYGVVFEGGHSGLIDQWWIDPVNHEDVEWIE